MIGMAVVSPLAFAQTTDNSTGSGTAAGSTATGGSVIANGDIVQFNNLVVQSVSGSGNAGEILATTNYALPRPAPMPSQPYTPMSGGTNNQNVPGNTQSTSDNNSQTVPQTDARCLKYESQNSSAGHYVPCPTNVPTVNGATTGGSSQIMPYPMPPTIQYRIEVDATTRLFLRDRSAATLADFSAGDRLNVFGTYNTDGSIQALVVRNLSKPIEKTFFQLNNAELVSVSQVTGNSSQIATLVVIQRSAYPCYNFGTDGNKSAVSYPCPAGATTNSQALNNLTVPSTVAPIWNAVRKYEVQIDSGTIIMDRTRNRLAVSDLVVGDKLNIYGAIAGDNGVVDADVIRDLSRPVAAQEMSGTVTQVNSDGSFVVQTSDGSTYTVQNPVRVGMTVRLNGLVDEANKLITQITQLIIGQQPKTYPVPMPPTPAPMTGNGQTQTGQ